MPNYGPKWGDILALLRCLEDVQFIEARKKRNLEAEICLASIRAQSSPRKGTRTKSFGWIESMEGHRGVQMLEEKSKVDKPTLQSDVTSI